MHHPLLFALWMLVATQLTILSVTLYLHRSQAHRAVDFPSWLNHLFRGWLWFSTGISTVEWVAVHRKHHARCETVDDPHSPHTKGIGAVFFKGAWLYRQEAANTQTIERFGKGAPNDWLEQHVYRKHTLVGIGLCLALNIALWGAWGVLSWGVQMIWIPLWAAGVINGFGHWWGYRNYASPDKSTNLLPWGLWIGGEELHNNHHGHAKSAKFSHRPWEVDIGWGVLMVLKSLGWAHIKHLPPTLQWLPDKVECDLHTLEALIAHRYALMRQYQKQVLLKVQTTQRYYVQSMLERMEQLWSNSLRSKEELVNDLAHWIRDAQASGVTPLVSFAQRLPRLSSV